VPHLNVVHGSGRLPKDGPLVVATVYFAIAAILVQYLLFNASHCLSLSPFLYVWQLIQVASFNLAVAGALYHSG